jgi:hypothetical protein
LKSPGVDPLAKLVFALLVLACFAAFFVTQRLKHTPTVVQRFLHGPYFLPQSNGPRREERLSFRIREADLVTVTIIGPAEEEVATLVRDRPLAGYTQLKLRWNGRRGPTSSGTPAPPGEYRVRVDLLHRERKVVSPWSFKLLLGSSATNGAG